jgi:hypothetical protein
VLVRILMFLNSDIRLRDRSSLHRSSTKKPQGPHWSMPRS